MKKISSAIFIAAFLVFINCKNNAGNPSEEGDKNDSANAFYQSIIRLGNGFIDVFNAFSGLVADTFFKADPKKSDVKIYFESISKTLTETKTKLGGLNNNKEDGGTSGAAGAEGGKKESVKSVVESAVSEMSAWLEEMIKAADAATKGGTGGGTSIGNAADNQEGAAADAGSVKEIANGIKGIVDAAGKADGDKGDALKGVEAAADDNKDAGKLFKTSGGAGADVADVAKAATAVSAVSGKQILKAIVDAAGDGDQAGATAAQAKNPIAAAIGEADDNGSAFNVGEMKKSDKIAAAIVLRGLAKGGKFAAANNDGGKAASVKSVVESAVSEMSAWLEEMIKAAADAATKGGTGDGTSIGNATDNEQGAAADAGSVNGIANGIKGIVEAAGKAEGKDGDALKGVEAAGDGNEDAGKLFKTSGGADAAAVAKAATAVSAVSGKQILKAIVEAAGGADQAGAQANAAKNPIAAAIGAAGDDGAAFNDDGMKKSDKIAAAIVLRGLAKNGKFAAANAEGGKAASVKSVVESAVSEMSAWLEEMIKAADAATKGGTGGGGTSIGNAEDNKEGAKADAGSVNGIANGIKGIVEAAGKAEGKDGNALKGVEAAGDNEANKDAGKLFGTQGGGVVNAAAVAKAATAVSAVSGKQILKAIVEAAGNADGDQAGAQANAATNPIAAAIGEAGDNGAF
ncbi:variable large family protein [Borreliella bavariensis]|uniref:variable large family protein n=1 Tax=Borreliella bavariensis TaxID=664662 RepID=UPI001BFFE4A5|nr:variable large family protein [Borreliella bavariensis]